MPYFKQDSCLPPKTPKIAFLEQGSDRCVMCGLCLPHCPTYRLTGDESESPRGRIALMGALAKDQLTPTPRLLGHLDRCLTCRACEAVCPSLVPYGRLIDTARAQVWGERSRWQRLKKHFLYQWIMPRPAILQGLGRLVRLAQLTGVVGLARRSGLLRALGWASLESLVPKLPPQRSWQSFYPAQGEERGEVALFTGCVANIVEQPLLMATVQLLNWLGYGVHIPKKQVCCGALARHEGQPKQALALAFQNVKAFAKVEAVICTASGCTANLIDYPQWAQEEGVEVAAIRTFTSKIREVNQFLLHTAWPAEGTLKPLDKRVVVQEPCSLRYVLQQHKAVYALLRRIPKADILPLPDNEQCCGAAGNYMLTQPIFAQSLRAEKIDTLQKIQPDILVTSNIGCSLHLAAGIREAGFPIEVLHPVQLLVRQLDF
ncbi:(Fe-S)-binding protein [Nitrosococcus wardiae]|uniref:Glycolate oxidase iron-sulfur subunit n=1 Tax=Nitrosococcus wardiae TaxID=1814290 RepID=A0A4V1AWE4_9GAMM|nr:heterodisulfide reductase-related iron-sulfur binding cluster [Nitrosococcus wardiae]QBQ56345.1 4Fe-4S dicluster domain-containing protein [Nitrosococcus wardiae]